MTSRGVFNFVEAMIWFSIGLAILVSAFTRPQRRLRLVAATSFIAFGVTDLVEIRTGAWYRPISLLVANALCLAMLVGCGIVYYRNKNDSSMQ